MTFVEFQSREDAKQILDISAEATVPFGFVFQDRVSTPKGPGTVLGVSRTGDLYFQLDCDVGCSYWGSCKSKSDFERKGFCVIPQDNIRRHRIKKVLISGVPRLIALQDTNGPCPLLAALNALSIMGRPTDAMSDHCDVVTEHTICAAIDKKLALQEKEPIDAKGALDIGGTTTLAGLIAAEGASLRTHFTSTKVESLYKGLDVSPFFTDVSDFEGERDAAFFAALGIRMFHLWVVEEESLPEEIRRKSYNQVQDLAVSDNESSTAAADILNRFRSQATELGVLRLSDSLAEGEVGVLFRNNHFSTIIKLDGNLLVLVTDEGYGDKGLIVFEMLSLSGDTLYRDGNGKVIEPIVLSALDAYGDRYNREDILGAQAQLGCEAQLADIVKLIDSRTAPQGRRPSPEAPAPMTSSPNIFDQLIEMGFDPEKCREVCSRKPESMEVAVALVLQ